MSKSKKLRILLTRKLHDVDLKKLRKQFDVEIYSGKIPMPKKIILSRIIMKDGLICFPYDVIDKDVID